MAGRAAGSPACTRKLPRQYGSRKRAYSGLQSAQYGNAAHDRHSTSARRATSASFSRIRNSPSRSRRAATSSSGCGRRRELGLKGAAAETYANELAAARAAHHGDDAAIGSRTSSDFAAKGVSIDATQIQLEARALRAPRPRRQLGADALASRHPVRAIAEDAAEDRVDMLEVIGIVELRRRASRATGAPSTSGSAARDRRSGPCPPTPSWRCAAPAR